MRRSRFGFCDNWPNWPNYFPHDFFFTKFPHLYAVKTDAGDTIKKRKQTRYSISKGGCFRFILQKDAIFSFPLLKKHAEIIDRTLSLLYTEKEVYAYAETKNL